MEKAASKRFAYFLNVSLKYIQKVPWLTYFTEIAVKEENILLTRGTRSLPRRTLYCRQNKPSSEGNAKNILKRNCSEDLENSSGKHLRRSHFDKSRFWSCISLESYENFRAALLCATANNISFWVVAIT